MTGDGAQGYPDRAPYDRVISTAAVWVGELPYPWVAQTRPGGVIVTPMRTDFGGSVPLVRLTVDEHGTATGQPDQSWAVGRYDGSPGPRQIRQYGPRRLWDEVEVAFRCGAAAGKPPLDRSQITITPDSQTVS